MKRVLPLMAIPEGDLNPRAKISPRVGREPATWALPADEGIMADEGSMASIVMSAIPVSAMENIERVSSDSMWIGIVDPSTIANPASGMDYCRRVHPSLTKGV